MSPIQVNHVRGKVIIVSGGGSADAAFFKSQVGKRDDCLIIGCDGGSCHLKSWGIKPDVIIGDMDSIDAGLLARYDSEKIKIIKYPAEKDFTDTELALDYALEVKPEKIYIWCALGGRMDHTLSNIFLLFKGQEKGIQTVLIDPFCEIFLADQETHFTGDTGKTVSLLSLSPEVTGITLSGFQYPLKNENLKIGESRGISNRIRDNEACIRIANGRLLIIKYRNKDRFPEAV